MYDLKFKYKAIFLSMFFVHIWKSLRQFFFFLWSDVTLFHFVSSLCAFFFIDNIGIIKISYTFIIMSNLIKFYLGNS